MQPFNFVDYAHHKVYAKIDYVPDPEQPQCYIADILCRSVAQSSCTYTLDFARGLMTVYISAAVSSAGATYAPAVDNIDGKRVLKDDCRTVTLDGIHGRHLVDLVWNKNYLALVEKPLRMRYSIRIDMKPITSAQAIKLSNIANISAVVIRCGRSFIVTIQIFHSYARPFEGDCAVSFVDGHVLNIVNDMMSPNFLDANSKAIYTRYTRVAEMMINDEGFLPLFVRFSTVASMLKTLIITFHDIEDPIITKWRSLI